MTIIFILPKQEELAGLTINNNNQNFKIISPCDNLILDDPNGELDKNQTAINIVTEIENINPNGENYLLYHIGNLVNLDSELKKADGKLTARLYSSADGEATYNNIKNLIKEICNGNISSNLESIIRDFFFDKELEAKLNLLHLCLTPTGAKEAKLIHDYHLIKNIVESVMISKDESVIEYLAKQTDCFDHENYLLPLTKLRNELLPS